MNKLFIYKLFVCRILSASCISDFQGNSVNALFVYRHNPFVSPHKAILLELCQDCNAGFLFPAAPMPQSDLKTKDQSLSICLLFLQGYRV